MTDQEVKLSIDTFGSVENPITKKEEEVTRFTWQNANGMSVQLITYGAIITSIKVPNRDGKVADVVLGFDDISTYKNSSFAYFGALVGRVANRIDGGQFLLNGKVVDLEKNIGNNGSLHGGKIGFDKFNFNYHVSGNSVFLTSLNPDGWEGYPGDCLTTVKCELLSDNSLTMEFQAVTTKPTAITLTNHSYFNLAGHETGYEELYRHVIAINADKITETDAGIPTGKLTNVAGTAFDLRISRELGLAMRNLGTIGFDDNFCINIPKESNEPPVVFVARAVHPESGRYLEVFSNQPGVQFFTSNYLVDPFDNINPSTFVNENYHEVDGVLVKKEDNSSSKTKNPLRCPDGLHVFVGKGGAHYLKHQAFCLETQKFPDAVHHDNFPSIIVNPGDTYKHEVIYKFGWEE